MHLFISAGEPSGDLHGANLALALRDRHPGLTLSGFGGDRMTAAGVRLLYPLTDLAVMWFGRVIAHLPTFFKLGRQAEVFFRSKRPDAVVLIDYPGFHWALAKRAHRAGVPVYYFVPPQLWAWHGSRVKKVRRWVTAVLTALPFEDEWYRTRGVTTHYIGHPYFDELAAQTPDADWVAARKRAGTPVVALLPGSRTQEVTSNFPMMVAAAKQVRDAVPGVRFLVAAFKEHQAKLCREALAGAGLDAEVHVGRTPEIIEAADAAIAVSGSVGLELMYRLLPSVVVYKVSPWFEWVARRVASRQLVSLVNLLADRELFPEVAGGAFDPDRTAAPVVRWLTDPAAREAVVADLRELRQKVAVPGACDRAADFLLAELANPARSRPAAAGIMR
ncbi:MAG: lipid-A-disaccharide synthase [Gemmataceae bacterium]